MTKGAFFGLLDRFFLALLSGPGLDSVAAALPVEEGFRGGVEASPDAAFLSVDFLATFFLVVVFLAVVFFLVVFFPVVFFFETVVFEVFFLVGFLVGFLAADFLAVVDFFFVVFFALAAAEVFFEVFFVAVVFFRVFFFRAAGDEVPRFPGADEREDFLVTFFFVTFFLAKDEPFSL